MKHLDAPWRCVEDRSDVLFSHTIHSNGDRIARVLQTLHSWKNSPDEIRKKEAARAQLIAAAPEMLDKLKACSLFLERERTKINKALDDLNEFIATVEGAFAGEDFEPPPLKVNPAAIEARVAFLSQFQNEDKRSND